MRSSTRHSASSADEQARGIVDLARLKELIERNADRFPARELTGYLEINGPKIGQGLCGPSPGAHARGIPRCPQGRLRRRGGIAMIDMKQWEAWFVTGSQGLYGKETLAKVAEHAREIAAGLSAAGTLPVKVVFKPVVTTPEGILALCREANAANGCIGLITWMHTFSPAKMWIAGHRRTEEALRPPAHAVQPRHPVGDDRHGFHESQPVRARRPRVRIHRHPHAAGAHGGGGPLARGGGAAGAGHVAAGRLRLAGRPGHEAWRASATTCARWP